MSTTLPRPPLATTVLAVTTLCPRVMHATAKAGHGPLADRKRQLAEALRTARELVTQLELAQAQLGWDKDGAAA